MKQLFLLLAFVPLTASAQWIRRSQAATGKTAWIVETQPVVLRSAGDTKTEAAFRTGDSTLLLVLSGAGSGANTVLAGDELILLLDNDSTLSLKSPTVQSAERGKGTYHHDYVLYAEELERISRRPLQALRKYSAEGYTDIYLDAASAGRLRETGSAFFDELRKHNLIVPSAAAGPAFPGGREVWLRFVNRNLRTVSSLEPGDRRFALVQFRVLADGSVEDLQVTQGSGAAFDHELLRILRRMPRWKPARRNGEAVNALVTQPFTLVKTPTETKVYF